MSVTLVRLAVNVVAIAILVLGIYFPRHQRPDLVFAFFAVNMGIFGVAVMLAGTDVGMGLCLGLFGVLSITRLRSSEISQCEVSYYFAALASGLINGLSTALSPSNSPSSRPSSCPSPLQAAASFSVSNAPRS